MVSSVGSWSQSLAVTWLVLELTGRSDSLGIAVALQFLPLLVLGAWGGVLADRFDNRRILLATSAVSTALAAAFALVVGTGSATIWWVYGLTFMLGLVLAVERPTMQAILFQLAGPRLLPSAVAVNGTINSVSRLIGPAIAGALIATVGIGPCFYFNAASYLVVIGALMALRTRELVERPMSSGRGNRLREGLAYVRTHPDVLRPLVVMAVVGTVAYNFQTTFPAMVRFGFGLGAAQLGTVLSVSAIGSIIGGIVIAGVKPHPRRTLMLALVGLGVAFIAQSAAPTYWAFVGVSIVLGFASAVFQAVDTVVLQQATDPSMQGRVMALHQMAWFGSTPIGAIAMGWVIQATSPRVPFALGGASALICALVVVRRPSLRP